MVKQTSVLLLLHVNKIDYTEEVVWLPRFFVGKGSSKKELKILRML